MDEIDQLWELATQYASTASERIDISPPSPNDSEAFDQELDRLRIHFLFPNVDDRGRDMLQGALNASRAFGFGVGGLHNPELVEPNRGQIERMTNEVEQLWMDFKTWLELMRPSRTDPQQKVIERHIFRAPKLSE